MSGTNALLTWNIAFAYACGASHLAQTASVLLQVFSCEQARVDLEQIFGREAQALVAHLNIEGQHRGAVAAATAMQNLEAAHSHDEGIAHDPKKCKLCTDDGEHHDHDHDHDHSHHDDGHAMAEEEGKHKSHAHEHADGHKHDHGHAHEHGHEHHHHHHERQETTAASRFGIRSFVYKSRLPFHPQRYTYSVLALAATCTWCYTAESGPSHTLQALCMSSSSATPIHNAKAANQVAGKAWRLLQH